MDVNKIDVDLINQELRNYNISRIFENEIEYDKKIGEGQQANVYKGKYKGNLVAIKVLKEIDFKNFAHELFILSMVDHQSIPLLHGLIVEENNISLVTDYIEGVYLVELIKLNKLSFKDKLEITKNLCKVLIYIQSLKIIHRDLKPENIIVDDKNNQIYLIDFGIAKWIPENQDNVKTRVAGTFYYIAPEIFDDNVTNSHNETIGDYRAKSDVWSFGCIVSFLFSGIFPWGNEIPNNMTKSKDIKTLIMNFLINKNDFPIPTQIDESIKKIIENATNVDPKKRMEISELIIELDKISS